MAQRQVLQGRYAEASVSGVVFLYLVDWEVEFETHQYPISGHGDVWVYEVPLRTSWRFKAKGYCALGESPRYLKNLWKSSGTPASVTISGYDKSAASGTLIFQGTGQPVQGVFNAPMAPATQAVLLRGYGPPTTGVSP